VYKKILFAILKFNDNQCLLMVNPISNQDKIMAEKDMNSSKFNGGIFPRKKEKRDFLFSFDKIINNKFLNNILQHKEKENDVLLSPNEEKGIYLLIVNSIYFLLSGICVFFPKLIIIYGIISIFLLINNVSFYKKLLLHVIMFFTLVLELILIFLFSCGMVSFWLTLLIFLFINGIQLFCSIYYFIKVWQKRNSNINK
jgi:hypothetical protein